mmetsp:Transcript_36538/g.43655  ORF Transcript_36538/g.43655 Transcript_36538/m.43655 type:complete len:283 (+) Transcript_36538:486-1334(+)
MGSTEQDDQFVVFTDGRLPMHLVLVWKDTIPDDWEGLGEKTDKRVACELPVVFDSLESPESVVSEQSVLVNGYSSIVVNNFFSKQRAPSGIKALDANYALLYGSDFNATTPGIQRIDWDPDVRKCNVVWTNDQVTLPNGIPTMSTDTNLVYTIAQKEGNWGLQSLDFDTGQHEAFCEVPAPDCSPAMMDFLSKSPLATGVDYIEEYPQSCENSMYSATQVGPNHAVYTGTFVGLSRYQPIVTPSNDGTEQQGSATSMAVLDVKRNRGGLFGLFAILPLLLLF